MRKIWRIGKVFASRIITETSNVRGPLPVFVMLLLKKNITAARNTFVFKDTEKYEIL